MGGMCFVHVRKVGVGAAGAAAQIVRIGIVCESAGLKQERFTRSKKSQYPEYKHVANEEVKMAEVNKRLKIGNDRLEAHKHG